jgi:hypothetical protein
MVVDLLQSSDSRTNQLLDLFKFGSDKTYIFKGLDWETIYNIEFNEFDCWRLYNYFQELYSSIDSQSAYMKHEREKAKNFIEKAKNTDPKMFVLKDEAQKQFLIKLKHPKKIKEELKLPFNEIFLDTDIKINDDRSL